MKCEHCGEEVGEFYGHLDEHIWIIHKDKIWEDWWNRMLNSKNTIAETYKLSVEGGYPKTFLGMLEEFRQDWFKFKEYHAVGGSKNNETQEIKTYKRALGVE